MEIFKLKNELISRLNQFREGRGKMGLVPTMGALHEGHLKLVQRSCLENDLTVVTIFVNPTQFNNPEDLKKYPRNLENDLITLQKMEGALILFAPDVQQMYDADVTSKKYDFDGLDRVMEGAFREGHFNGVGTIVEALLRLIQPDRAYFGEKDYQQLQIIRKLVRKKNLNTEVIGCPIVREDSGLALSSRNQLLSPAQKEKATFIYKTLQTARKKFGTKSALQIKEWIHEQFRLHPDLELEYIEIAHAETLKPLIRKHKNQIYRAFIAAHIGGVRLIDNIALN